MTPPHPAIALLTEAIDAAITGDRTQATRDALVAAYSFALEGALDTIYHRTADQVELANLLDRPTCPHCGAELGNAP